MEQTKTKIGDALTVAQARSILSFPHTGREKGIHERAKRLLELLRSAEAMEEEISCRYVMIERDDLNRGEIIGWLYDMEMGTCD